MTSKERILAAVRKNMPAKLPKPEISFTPQTFDDPIARFREVAEGVGAQTFLLKADEKLENFYNISPESKVISALKDIEDQNINRDEITKAHDMQHIDYCCFKAELGVAENGALLSHCNEFNFRSVYFLAQHLIVVVDADKIKNNMHEAYKDLTDMEKGDFTVFISGPSKTADIEQCLVIGAHGARSMQIFILE